jgi:hypothetical protein
MIKKDDRLNDDDMYQAGKAVRNQIFMQMKYFMEIYKKDTLSIAVKAMGRGVADEKQNQYADYIYYYIDKKITSQRNNAIHGLKKVLLGLDDGEGK